MLSNIKNLVFEGGSVRGIAYVGAIGALQNLNCLDFDNLEKVGGTSVGGMTALALALNYSTNDLIRVLTVDIQEFLDDASSRVSKETLLALKDASNRLLYIYTLPSIWMDLRGNLGLFPGKDVRDWLEELIYEKTGIHNCTFEELHNLRLQKPDLHLKDLYVVGFNLNIKVPLTFCWNNTPKAIIADSVRISMGIPFIFAPYQFFEKNDAGESVLSEAYKNDLWIDGGISENYPIRLFDTNEVNMETLGFYLVFKEELTLINGKENPSEIHRVEIAGFQDYVKALISNN